MSLNVELTNTGRACHGADAILLLAIVVPYLRCVIVMDTMINCSTYRNSFGIVAPQTEWIKNLFTMAANKLDSLIADKNVAKSPARIHDLGIEALNENTD